MFEEHGIGSAEGSVDAASAHTTSAEAGLTKRMAIPHVPSAGPGGDWTYFGMNQTQNRQMTEQASVIHTFRLENVTLAAVSSLTTIIVHLYRSSVFAGVPRQ